MTKNIEQSKAKYVYKNSAPVALHSDSHLVVCVVFREQQNYFIFCNTRVYDDE